MMWRESAVEMSWAAAGLLTAMSDSVLLLLIGALVLTFFEVAFSE